MKRLQIIVKYITKFKNIVKSGINFFYVIFFCTFAAKLRIV